MYEIILILLIVLCVFSLGYFLFLNYNLTKHEKEIIKKDIERIKKEKKNEYNEVEQNYKNKAEQLRKEFEEKQNIYNKSIEQTKSIIQEEEEKKNLILNQKQEIINRELNEYKIKEENRINKELEIKINELIKQYESFQDNIETSKNEYSKDLEKIKKELEDYRLRRAVVNEAIRREEETANKIDFHRIILSETDKDDINYLLSIEEKIHNKDLLHKLIWSEYLQKPFNQMLNNIFGSKVPKNVIYCIENIKTHKKYIGKTSAEVSKRWTEHIKSSLNIGGIKKQKIHEALFKHWDEYTFSILEETTKEELSGKEKYYISFFETDKYGFNQRSGG